MMPCTASTNPVIQKALQQYAVALTVKTQPVVTLQRVTQWMGVYQMVSVETGWQQTGLMQLGTGYVCNVLEALLMPC